MRCALLVPFLTFSSSFAQLVVLPRADLHLRHALGTVIAATDDVKSLAFDAEHGESAAASDDAAVKAIGDAVHSLLDVSEKAVKRFAGPASKPESEEAIEADVAKAEGLASPGILTTAASLANANMKVKLLAVAQEIANATKEIRGTGPMMSEGGEDETAVANEIVDVASEMGEVVDEIVTKHSGDRSKGARSLETAEENRSATNETLVSAKVNKTKASSAAKLNETKSKGDDLPDTASVVRGAIRELVGSAKAHANEEFLRRRTGAHADTGAGAEPVATSSKVAKAVENAASAAASTLKKLVNGSMSSQGSPRAIPNFADAEKARQKARTLADEASVAAAEASKAAKEASDAAAKAAMAAERAQELKEHAARMKQLTTKVVKAPEAVHYLPRGMDLAKESEEPASVVHYVPDAVAAARDAKKYPNEKAARKSGTWWRPRRSHA